MRTLGETRFASATDGVRLAYRTVGDGPVDLFWSFNQLNDVEAIGQHRPILEYFDALAEFARVIVHDRRGMGRSGGERGDLATDVADVLSLLDAVDAKRPYLASAVVGGAVYVAFAAQHPNLVAGVIWHGAFAQSIKTNSYPWGATTDEMEENARRAAEGWGTDAYAQRFVAGGAPSVAADADAIRFYARWMRETGSPEAAANYLRAQAKLDLHPMLPKVRVPVLVLDRAGEPEEGAYVASLLPQGRFINLEGDDFIPYYHRESVVGAIRQFVADTSASPDTAPRGLDNA